MQPIVENSIYHGIRPQRGKGYIEIVYEKRDGNLIITVSDNGVGYFSSVEENDRNLIKAKLGGIGMKNVDQRIKLLYGNQYGIEVRENQPHGTVVIYTLKCE